MPRLTSCLFLGLVLAQERDLARLRGVRHHLERVARLRETGQTEHLDRARRLRLLERLAAVVDERPDSADVGTDDEVVADVERPVLHEDRGDRAAATVDLRFQHRAGRYALGVGLVLAQLRDEQDHFEQCVEIFPLLRGDRHHYGLAPPILGCEIALGKFLLDTLGIGIRLVDLVDGDQDRDVRHPRVVDRFLRLRHDAVVGGDDEHDDVRHAGAPRAHRGERCMPGGVEEHNAATVDLDRVGADVLRNAARLSFGNPCFPDGVEQRRFPVVDVAHYRHYRGTRYEVAGIGRFRLEDNHLLLERAHLDVGAELAGDHGRGLGIERGVDGQHHPLFHQLLEDFLRLDLDLLGKILDRHPLRQRYRPRNRRRRRRRARRGLRAWTPVGTPAARAMGPWWRSIADGGPRRERSGQRRANRL